jgi:5-methylthioadenosine/S-adenosylhomocysteine deaminase
MRKRKTADNPPDRSTDNVDTPAQEGSSRREFLLTGAAGLAAVAVGPGAPAVTSFAAGAAATETVRNLEPKRKVLKGGVVLTLDKSIGDFEKADVLIEGKKIVAVGPNLDAGGEKIDCSGAIVMPGFISTHHHQYYTIQRGINADGYIVFADTPPNPYQQNGSWPYEAYSSIQNIWTAGRIGPASAPIWDMRRPPYDPEDLYLCELVASLSQITQGLTMGTDTSQASHTPAHTDAMIQGLMDSGRRTLYDYSNGTNRSAQDPNQPNEFPGAIGNTTSGIGRLARTYFNSKDQLVTLGFSGGPTNAFPGATYTGWQLGRAFGAFLNAHSVGSPNAIIAAAADPRNGTDWSDVTRVHCVRWQDNNVGQISNDPYTNASRAWEVLADHGAHASIAVIIEMQMRHGMPPFQMALNHGILPSLSPDVDTNMTPDPFSMMRGAFCLQRALSSDFAFHESNPNNLPVPQSITCRQVLEMMTIAGAAGSGVLDKVGTLTPGKEADIVVLDTRNINVAPVNNAPGAVVTMMDTRHVRDVLIAGKVVFKDGKLVGWNADKLVKDLERSRERVLARIRGTDGNGGGPGRIGTIPKGMNSEASPYRPNFLGSCCYKGQNTLAPDYVLRP